MSDDDNYMKTARDPDTVAAIEELKAKVARDFVQMVERETIDTARYYKYVNGNRDGDRGWVNLRMECLKLALAEQQGGYPADMNAVLKKAFYYWRFALYAEAPQDVEPAAPEFDLKLNRF